MVEPMGRGEFVLKLGEMANVRVYIILRALASLG